MSLLTDESTDFCDNKENGIADMDILDGDMSNDFFEKPTHCEQTAPPATSPQEEKTDDPITFEGCEKRLTLYFKPKEENNKENKSSNGGSSLRSIKRQEWSALLKHAQCSILNVISNDNFDAYLLSESSLFVYQQKIIIKTCGTTMLLHILGHLLNICNDELSLIPYFVLYSRSNLMYPNAQSDTYRSFDSEISYLNEYFNGFALVLGPLTNMESNGRWNVYVAGKPKLTHLRNNFKVLNEDRKIIEIVLFDVCQDSMKHFWQESKNVKERNNIKDIASLSGISDLIPKTALIDSHLFDPCGYSLNATLNDKYWSVHVTPECHQSFVSFETNFHYQPTYYFLINKIVKMFKPKRFSLIITTMDYKIIGGNKKNKNERYKKQNRWKRDNIIDWEFNNYHRKNHSKYDFSNHFYICWANYGIGSKSEVLKTYDSSNVVKKSWIVDENEDSLSNLNEMSENREKSSTNMSSMSTISNSNTQNHNDNHNYNTNNNNNHNHNHNNSNSSGNNSGNSILNNIGNSFGNICIDDYEQQLFDISFGALKELGNLRRFVSNGDNANHVDRVIARLKEKLNAVTSNEDI